MFAIIAAVLLVLGVIVPDVDEHSTTFWLLLGLAALALHFAFDVGLPAIITRRRPPSA